MVNDDQTWFVLPIQGEAIRRLTFIGNGKRAEVLIETVAGERISVPTEDLDLRLAAGMNVHLRSLDDIDLAQEVRWPPASVAVLEDARVHWWLPPEEWPRELEGRIVGESWQLSCVVRVRLGLTVRAI